MPQASGSRHSIGYIPEVTYGVTPATPAFKKLRHNSTTLNLSKTTFQSNELREDRMIADFRHGARQVGGNIVCELSAGSLDDFLELALCGPWTANVLKAGVIRKSMTLERKFADLVQYLRYTGVQVDTMQISASVGGIVTVTFGVIGQNVSDAVVIIAGATYPAAPTSSPMDCLSGTINEGGVPIAVATEISLNLSNGLEARHVIGGNGISLEPSIGRSNVTGTLNAYFESIAYYNKFANETASSLSFVATDGAKPYTILVPKLKYTGGNVDVPGEGPVMVALPFQGLYDSVTGTSLQITRTP